MAKLYGQSRTAFTSHFKMATGISPMNYVRRWRINLACRMLEENALSIDEIAFNSGYADTNAFNRAFKRETGSSPGAYNGWPGLKPHLGGHGAQTTRQG